MEDNNERSQTIENVNSKDALIIGQKTSETPHVTALSKFTGEAGSTIEDLSKKLITAANMQGLFSFVAFVWEEDGEEHHHFLGNFDRFALPELLRKLAKKAKSETREAITEMRRAKGEVVVEEEEDDE